jgi:hypothetical protein
MQNLHVEKVKLLATYLMNRMHTLIFAELFERYFRSPFCDTHAGAIVPALALATFKPDMLSFAFLLRHKIRPNRAGPSSYQHASAA